MTSEWHAETDVPLSGTVPSGVAVTATEYSEEVDITGRLCPARPAECGTRHGIKDERGAMRQIVIGRVPSFEKRPQSTPGAR